MLKTAQVGLGWWGNQVTQQLAESDKISIVCGVDPVPAAAEKYTAEHGLPVHADYQTVLDDPEIDAVILTIPHRLHEDAVVRAAAAGKQIFCEKPLALEVESARRMVDACREAGIVLGIGHERRFEPAWEELHRMATSGEFGEILHTEADFSHDFFRGMTADNWRGTWEEAPAAGWTGMGVHLADALMWMVGPIVEVHARWAQRIIPIESGDVISVSVRFANGAFGSITSVSATPFYGRMAIFGSEAWAEARDTQHVQTPAITHLYTRRKGDAEQSMRTLEPANAVRKNFEEWAAAAAGEGSYRFTPEQLFTGVAVLEAVARSAKSGKPEPVAQYE